MQRHEIPTHLEVEDKILGALTVRQLLFLAVGLSLSYGLWGLLQQLAPAPHRHLPLAVELALAAIPALCTLVLALAQPAGRPLEEWLLAMLRYAGQPKRYVWRPLPDEVVKEPPVGLISPAFVDSNLPRNTNEWATTAESEERGGVPA